MRSNLASNVGRLRGLLLIISLVSSSGCGGWWKRPATEQATGNASSNASAPVPSTNEATRGAVKFLEERVARDPDDFIAHNQLVGYYLKLEHETGDTRYLELALRAAQASLAAMPAEQNMGGLASLIRAEASLHQFASARGHALRYVELEPNKRAPYILLFDAQVELGDYDGASKTLAKLDELRETGVDDETRRARYAQLTGDTDAATKHLTQALAITRNYSATPADALAWYHWQLGETAFSIGQYEPAERHYNDALALFPNDIHARASLARVRAARGDIQGAIKEYENVNTRLPEPPYLAALADLYQLTGRAADAARTYAEVERVGRITPLESNMHARLLSIFYADHDLKAVEAYDAAVKDYAARQDIYGADTLAWTALKAGKIKEAQTAIKDALRLGTKDAKLLYHAGMIARAAGDREAARDYLTRALALNPQFDPLQVSIAKKALEGI
ncbi:MAG TPA: tetratricopeptide repeat protein [Pyrinomonadaceae bacterium]|nr:tetratricopeptide repeat protein [Pyrinomonadaceae bacterium]